MPNPIRRLWPWLGLFVLALIAWLAYRPGLTGGFLFDDFVNLDALGNSGPVDNWRTFWRFITSGTSDPFGRPLSLLSFLIDAQDWPADPAPFLRTNVLLHLFNGALLFALLRRLETAVGSHGARRELIALFASGVWLLHPLWVSTTLYVVQREAILPATFTLLGLLAFGEGRMRMASSDGREGVGLAIAGLAFGTLLASACKANGVLLPMFAWVLDATIYRRFDETARMGEPARRQWRWLRIPLLILPSVAVFAWVGSFLLLWNAPLATRPWSIGQRVLTEPRVLLDYLQLLFMPRVLSTGLFNDGYLASKGLLHPSITAVALVLIAGLVILGFAMRKRQPVLAAALLFFFAGHLLESTAVPLELYFEHRNYLPTLLLFWPLAGGLCRWETTRCARAALAATVLAIFATITWQRADLWGKPAEMAALWARQNPGSSRAQATAAISQFELERPDRALIRLEPAWRRHPLDMQIAFNYVNAACATRGLTATDKRGVADVLQHAPEGALMVHNWIEKAIRVAADGRCPGLGLEDVGLWIDATAASPLMSRHYVRDEDIEPLRAELALVRHRPEEALGHFNVALSTVTTPDVAARQASMLAEEGYYEQALAHLDEYERLKDRVRRPGWGMSWLHAKVLEWEDYWPFEMSRLRLKLHDAIAARDAAKAQAR
jgi:hypothetical protein